METHPDIKQMRLCDNRDFHPISKNQIQKCRKQCSPALSVAFSMIGTVNTPKLLDKTVMNNAAGTDPLAVPTRATPEFT